MIRKGFLAKQMLSGCDGLPNDILLFPGHHGNIYNLNSWIQQHPLQRSIHFFQTMLAHCSLGSFGVDIIATDHMKAARFVSRDMPIIHDPTTADEGNAIINLVW